MFNGTMHANASLTHVEIQALASMLASARMQCRLELDGKMEGMIIPDAMRAAFLKVAISACEKTLYALGNAAPDPAMIAPELRI